MQPDITRLQLANENAQPVGSASFSRHNPNQPVYSGRQPTVRDITKEFADASAELRQGQLIKDDFFTLFESVGALEIMDPKMDSGFVLPEKDAAVDNFDPLKPLLPSEIIGIMDQMLCFEMAWHQGHALSQTLFTSLHLYSLLTPYYRPLDQVIFYSRSPRTAEQMDPLISDILRAYCLGIMKSCDSVIQEVTSEHYYEEEDFVSQTFTQYLLTDFDESDIVSALQNAVDLLEQLDLPEDIKTAIGSRLQLRIHMVAAFKPLIPGDVVDKSGAWNEVLKSLPAVNDTVALGKAAPEVFTERVQRHLASNTPPTPMIKISWEEAYPKLRRMAEDSIEAYRILTIENPSPFNIVRFAWDFSSRKPQPSTYSRAVMQGLLFKNGRFLGVKPHLDLLLEDLRSLVLVGDPLLDPSNWEVELPTDPRYQTSRIIDEFMGKALDEYMNIPRMILQNRCRIRRTFHQSISILDGLQAEAETADAQLQDLAKTSSSSSSRRFAGTQLEPLQFFPLAAWSYFHKLRIMEWGIQLGFELEVYLPEELAEMYRFLAFVSHTRREHLQHIDFFLNLRHQRLHRRNNNNNNNNNEALALSVKASRTFISTLTAQAGVTADLASALSSLYAVLSSLNLLPNPGSKTPHPHPYSTPSLRHELRMKPYLQIGTPTLPSHSDLQTATAHPAQSNLTIIFNTISTHLSATKTGLAALKSADPKIVGFRGCEGAWGDEVKGLLGTCVAAGLTVAALRRGVEGSGIERVGDGVGVGEGGRMGLGLGLGGIVVEEVGEKRWAVMWVVPRVKTL